MIKICHRWLLVLLMNFIGQLAYAQFNEIIRSGRPGQSIGPYTVGRQIFQIQSGVDYFGYTTESSVNEGHGIVHNTVIRYGISEFFELSTLVDYRGEKLTDASGNTSKSGVSALDIGGRAHIYSGSGWVPSVGFQLRFRLPILSLDYEINKIAPRFILVTSQHLTESISLVTNTGASWNGVNNKATGHYVVNVGFPIKGKLGAFFENYGNFTADNFETRFDGGFAFLVNNDLQLDFLGGYGTNNGIQDYFVGTGVSWRTRRK